MGLVAQVDPLSLLTDLLLVVLQVCHRHASWMEGCACHDELYRDIPGNRDVRKRKFQDRTGLAQCAWKTARAPEMQLVQRTAFLQELRVATDNVFNSKLRGASDYVRARFHREGITQSECVEIAGIVVSSSACCCLISHRAGRDVLASVATRGVVRCLLPFVPQGSS